MIAFQRKTEEVTFWPHFDNEDHGRVAQDRQLSSFDRSLMPAFCGVLLSFSVFFLEISNDTSKDTRMP